MHVPSLKDIFIFGCSYFISPNYVLFFFLKMNKQLGAYFRKLNAYGVISNDN